MKLYNTEVNSYEDIKLNIREDSKTYTVRKSKIPKYYLKKTDTLMYIIEFLKCDGTLTIIKRGESIKGELLFISMNKEYKQELKTLIKKQFPNLNIFERQDGFGISCLSLSVGLAIKYNIPIGKKTPKTEMSCQKSKNLKEAKIILSSIIDSEGNIDPYSGDITIANRNTTYLNSIKDLLAKWFNIRAIDLSEITSGYSSANRIAIVKDDDVIKLSKIKFLNRDRQKRIQFIKCSLKKYRDDKKQLVNNVKEELKEPQTIKQISNKMTIAPFIIKRLLRNIKAKKIGCVEENKRKLNLWSVTSLQETS